MPTFKILTPTQSIREHNKTKQKKRNTPNTQEETTEQEQEERENNKTKEDKRNTTNKQEETPQETQGKSTITRSKWKGGGEGGGPERKGAT